MTDRKILLLLGASSDIGQDLVRAVHGDYDTIIAHYNQSCEELMRLRSELGTKIQLLQADFADETSTDAFIEQVESLYDCPTHIVHLPAGKVKYTRFHQGDWNHVQRELHIQLRSIYQIVSRLIRRMTKRRGAGIVFVLTANTVSPVKYMADYTMVKFALLGLMKSLAAEYADQAVNINAVSPSMVETRFLSELPDAAVRQTAAMSPAKRNAVTKDVVPAIRFLLSEGASYITGQNITISGGGVI